MDKKLLIGSFMSMVLLTACGGGGGGSDDESSEGGDTSGDTNTGGGDSNTGGEDTSDGLAIASTCTVGPITIPDEFGGGSFLGEWGADGDFVANCFDSVSDLADSDSDTGASVSLKAGVPNMNVVSVERTFEFSQSCSDGDNTSATATSNYSTGVTTYTGTVNGQSLTCTDTFTPPLPTTVSNPNEIAELLFEWGLDDERSDYLTTTCPDDVEDDFDTGATCSNDALYNITVTDDAGQTHRVSGKVKSTGF